MSERRKTTFPTVSCFVCGKDILPDHVREIVQKHVNCRLPEKPKDEELEI